MPSISVFFGIIIRMFYNDHEPSHFHAEHQGLQATFDFNGEMLVGAIDSRTALRLIREWATLHRGELEETWRLAKIRQPLRQIAPLEIGAVSDDDSPGCR